MIMKIQISESPADRYRQSQVYGAKAQHSDIGQFSGAREGQSGASEPQGAQVVRTYPKVGRNDPCPCGSGKKYKYCHGK